ncbi:hypothetical protein [Erythrobacter colymbi]|uniref:hypothetical protein n=1 Tax=Erythrobacter colymbi TaxID=1161202 RepID=UPI00117DF4AC|nr:hypothetical protein [Erythrobacter colymbi]
MAKRTVTARMQEMTAALVACLLLAGCGGGDEASAPPTAGAAPAPTPSTPPVAAAAPIGQWRELILNNDGSINAAEYRRVANAFNTPEIVNYRLGPTATDFGTAAETSTVF